MNRELLKEEMDKRGLTVSSLAVRAGIDKSTVSKILSGESGCTVNTARKIISCMKLSRTLSNSIFFE